MQRHRAQGNSAVLILPVLAGLSAAAFFSIRLAWSDSLYREATAESVSEAVRIDSGNASYHLGLASLLEIAGEDSRGPLRDAVARRPLDADIWIRLGLQEEIHGRFKEAERRLLVAARLSRKYEARWTLANFYFRRGRADQFWGWARDALEVSYGDRSPLFRLCWAVDPDPGVILERAVPRRREIHRAWVSFLFGANQDAAAAGVIQGLLPRMEPEERAFFLDATDRLLSRGMVPDALAAWNALCEGGWVDRAPLDPSDGEIITNPEFHTRSVGRGFGWRISRSRGVFVTQRPGGWKISFSGNQPESCIILSQSVPLREGLSYRFRSSYRSESTGLARENSDSGVRWSLTTLDGDLLARSEPLQVEGEGEAVMAFTAPPGALGARLTLHYRRSSGSVRNEGSLTLHTASMTGG